jgi:succinate dehydrogenase/fumarate reductase flavoprotein subunit
LTDERITDKKLSRRQFVGAAAGGAAALGAGALLVPKAAGATEVPRELRPTGADPQNYEFDVVVCGAGGGGMSAGCSAAQQGLKTLILEVSRDIGGGGRYSGGVLHTSGQKTWPAYLAYSEGLADPVLAETFCNTFHNEFIPWLTQIGASFHQLPSTGILWESDWQMGTGADAASDWQYFQSLRSIFLGFGGTILTHTRALKLLTDTNGVLAGVRASTWENSPIEENQTIFDVTSKAVILCTGNFMNNPEMKMRYMGHDADRAYVMGVPYARGDGHKMAQELGAAMSGSMSTFSGIPVALTPMPQTETDPVAFEAASAQALPDGSNFGTLVEGGLVFAPGWVGLTGPLFGGSLGTLVNLEGNRFVDENDPEDSKYPRLTQAILAQRQGMAFMVADQNIYNTYGASLSGGALAGITAAGGTVFTDTTIQKLASDLSAVYPFYAGNFVNTITAYNTAIANSTTAQLNPPRTAPLSPISTSPFYAVPVTVCIYYNMGGLAINSSAQVLDTQKKPILGLYASSPPAGGVMNTIYMGGNAAAGTFGYIAGQSAAAYIQSKLWGPVTLSQDTAQEAPA